MSKCIWCKKEDCIKKNCKFCNENFSCISRHLHENECKVCKKTCVDMNQHRIKCDLC